MAKRAKNSLDYYESIAEEAIKRDEKDTELFKKIDAMERCEFSLPPEMSVLPGIRKIVNTDPSDSLKAAIRTFSTISPSIELHPMTPNREEKDRMDAIEQALLWHFRRSCSKPESPLTDIVGQATRYMKCCFTVEYLPYVLKGREDKRSKSIRRHGDYVWTVYNPSDVHEHYDKFGLESVVLCTVMKANRLRDEIGEDNSGIKKLTAEILKGVKDEDKESTMRKVDIKFYDFMDWNDRVKWAKVGESKSFEIMREAHGLPFLNWVVTRGTNPLLKSTVDSFAWEDAIVIGTLQNWLVMQAAAHPAYATTTPSGRGVDINFTSGVSTLDLRSGEQIFPMSPRQLDPHLAEIYSVATSKIRNTIGTKYLQNLDFPANTPFATVNALITASLANLHAPKRVAEAAIADGFSMNLRWIKYSDIPLVGKRAEAGDEEKPFEAQGADVVLTAKTENLSSGQFSIGDPEDIVISVELKADTATDKQARINNAMNLHDKLMVPVSRAHEEVGLENSTLLVEEWMQEQYDIAELKADVTKIQAEAELEIQRKQMQMQLEEQQKAQQAQVQAQQQAQQQGGGQEQGPQAADMSQFVSAQGSGFDPNNGGQPAQMVAPGTTREQISQTDATGMEMAG